MRHRQRVNGSQVAGNGEVSSESCGGLSSMDFSAHILATAPGEWARLAARRHKRHTANVLRSLALVFSPPYLYPSPSPIACLQCERQTFLSTIVLSRLRFASVLSCCAPLLSRSDCNVAAHALEAPQSGFPTASSLIHLAKYHSSLPSPRVFIFPTRLRRIFPTKSPAR